MFECNNVGIYKSECNNIRIFTSLNVRIIGIYKFECNNNRNLQV